MEIYVLDEDLTKSVQYLPDTYVIKLSSQMQYMLCTVYYNLGISNELEMICRPVELNSDVSNWLIESLDNWLWLKEYAQLVQKEYQYRFGEDKIRFDNILERLVAPPLDSKGITRLNKGITCHYSSMNMINAYRQYFIDYKQHLKQYTRREVPDWFI